MKILHYEKTGYQMKIINESYNFAPETQENVELAQASGYISTYEYPYAELILCCGFFVMYILEEVIHWWVHKNKNQVLVYDHHTNPSNGNIANNSTAFKISGSATQNGFSGLEKQNGSAVANQDRCNSTASVAVLVGCENELNVATDYRSSAIPLDRGNSIVEALSVNIEQKSYQDVSTFKTAMIVLILSIHGALEGLSIGLESSNQGVWMLLVVVDDQTACANFR